jgi:hypothetical protein
MFASIVGACEFAGHFLHEATDLSAIDRIDQQVHVVGGNAEIQQSNIVLMQVLTEQGPVAVPIPSKLQQKRPVMTAMRQMENSPIGLESVDPWHGEYSAAVELTLRAKLEHQNRA